MATQFGFVAPLQGVKSFMDFAALFDDKKRWAEICAVARAIEKERQALNATIETYGKVSDIDRLHSEAEAHKTEAARSIQAAHDKAEGIIEEALAEASGMEDDRNALADEQAAAVEETKLLRASRKSLAATQETAVKAEATAEKAKAAAEQAETAAREREAEYEAKIAKSKEAWS